MPKIKYEFYNEDVDTKSVVDLMKRNQFGLAKFDKNLTVEKFIDYQHKKGTIFGVVGKKDGVVVSYVAAYKTGAQKVVEKNQVYVGRLIIDKKYRMNLFSIKDMFGLVIEELQSRGYNDFICKIAKENIASFYMMRKLGFVILDEQRTVFGFYVLHNYLISATKLFNRKDYVNRDSLANHMQKLDKRNLYRAESLIDGRFIHINTKSGKKNYFLCIDTLSGDIAGVYLKECKIKIWPCNPNFTSYYFEDENNLLKKCAIEFVDRDGNYEVQYIENKYLQFDVSEDINTMTLKIEGDEDTYTFRLDEMRKFGEKQKRLEDISLNQFSFEPQSGFLALGSCFKEMWPHICAPYIEGVMGPNYDKKISLEKRGQTLTAREYKEDYILERIYTEKDNGVEIKTRASILSEKKVQPMFQFGLYDLSYNMNIFLEDGTKENRKFNLKERCQVNDEMIFVDFLQKDYSKKQVQKIEINFDSKPNTTYRIQFNQNVRCFCHMNYLGIVYDEQVYTNKKNVDFGSILIEEV